MPGLVTILCHAECLGAWTSFWAPCRGTWPVAYSSPMAVSGKVPMDENVLLILSDRASERLFVVSSERVSRSDICGWRWHMNAKECVEAAIEHLAWLLYSKFAHYTFTIAAFRIIKKRFTGNGMKLQTSYVLLKLLWLV
eukprot:6140363-Amphidinium_carterae.1